RQTQQFTCTLRHVPSTTLTRSAVRRSASDLRIVLGQLVRRLRVEHRLPLSHGTVLARLEREGPETTSSLAVAERVRHPSMAQTVADLEGEAFVSRTPDPVDRRQVLIAITDAG